MSNTIQEDRLLDIRIKLARLMGATNERVVTIYPLSDTKELTIFDPPPGVETNFWISEDSKNGIKAEVCYVPIDPVSSAKDKDILIKWLASDWDRWVAFFKAFYPKQMAAMMNSESYLSRIVPQGHIGPTQAEWAFALMTASAEDILLAAAESLEI